jgi:hypothetical protein
MLEPGANATFVSNVQLLKQKLEMVSTDEGMQMDLRDRHEANADSPRIESLPPASNSKLDRFLQLLKQNLAMA